MSFKETLEEIAASLAAGFAGRLAEHAQARLAGHPAAAAACRLGGELAELLAREFAVIDEAPRPVASFPPAASPDGGDATTN